MGFEPKPGGGLAGTGERAAVRPDVPAASLQGRARIRSSTEGRRTPRHCMVVAAQSAVERTADSGALAAAAHHDVRLRRAALRVRNLTGCGL